MRFSNQDLRKLLIPLVIEQLLGSLMGMADTLMVSSCGESAVSGISIVDTLSYVLIILFSAMASGGSVVVAQFKGKGKPDMVSRAANQVFISVVGISLIITTIALAGNYAILKAIYGSIEPDVMTAARTYFYFSALSFPFLGIYNSGAALFRAVGNSKVSMNVSLIANLMNIVGNAVLIYVFDLGVLGASVSTLASRIISALAILYLLKKTGEIELAKKWRLDFGLLKKILYVGIPNGLENSMFQLGKVLLSSLIATFGTIAITANAVTNTVANFQHIPSTAIGMAMITVVGQCVGANEVDQAKYYIKKLIRISYCCVIALGILLVVFARPIFGLYHLGDETIELAIQLLSYSAICSMMTHPLSFGQAHALRAAGDVSYTMVVSVLSMWFCRILLAYVLADHMQMGVMGVWIAMTIDWVVRAICFTLRIHSGKWLKFTKKIV